MTAARSGSFRVVRLRRREEGGGGGGGVDGMESFLGERGGEGKVCASLL